MPKMLIILGVICGHFFAEAGEPYPSKPKDWDVFQNYGNDPWINGPGKNSRKTLSELFGKLRFWQQLSEKTGWVKISQAHFPMAKQLSISTTFDRGEPYRGYYKIQLAETFVRALASHIKANGSLESLDLEGIRLGPEGARTIFESLRGNKTLKALDIGSNSMGYGEVGQAHAVSLVEVINETALEILIVDFNGLDTEIAVALAKALTSNQNLKTLDISCNSVKRDGFLAFALMLKANSVLKELDISSNRGKEEGTLALADSLETNTSLEFLDISFNKIRDNGAIALAKSLQKNSTLRFLDLGSNDITDEALYALIEMVKVNKGLVELNILFNKISLEGVKRFEAALKENTTLKRVKISSYLKPELDDPEQLDIPECSKIHWLRKP